MTDPMGTADRPFAPYDSSASNDDGPQFDDRPAYAGSPVVPISVARGAKPSRLLDLLRAKDCSFLDAEFGAKASFDVDGLIPSRTAVLIATEGGLFKSTETRRLAIMTAFWMPGMVWMGRPVNEPQNPRVLVILGDETEELATDSFLGLEGAAIRDAWVAAHPGEDWKSRMKVLYCDDLDVLFRAEGQKVHRTKDGDAIYAFCEEYRPGLVIADTAAALTDIEIDSNTKHSQAIMRGAMAFTKLGLTWIWTHHFSKDTQTAHWRDARRQTKGSAGMVDGGRCLINGWYAYGPLDSLVRGNGIGGCGRDHKIICMAVTKGNVKGLEEGRTRVFVRPHTDDRFTPPMVEITDAILKHPLGRDCIDGRFSDSTYEKAVAKMLAADKAMEETREGMRAAARAPAKRRAGAAEKPEPKPKPAKGVFNPDL